MKGKQENILIINCGSSSLKFALMHPNHSEAEISGLAEQIGHKNAVLHWKYQGKKDSLAIANHNHGQTLQTILDLLDKKDQLKTLKATAHRVVHGGNTLTEPVIADRAILKKIASCIPLAPLHNPANLMGLELAHQHLPQLPHIALFDTAFHKTIPPHASQYAIPYELSSQYHIKRYGFHGLSYDYLLGECAHKINKEKHHCNLIICHLGNGASLCAIKAGRSVDVSMGLTPLAGIMMGTRSGDIDPGVIPYLMEETKASIDEVMNILTKQSGLLGVSGKSHDMRDIIEGMEAQDPQSILALDMMAYQIAKTIGSYYIASGTPDAIVFSGGIGENTPELREKVAYYLKDLNVQINPKRNLDPNKSGKISEEDSLPMFVIATNEEKQMAILTNELLERLSPCAPS